MIASFSIAVAFLSALYGWGEGHGSKRYGFALLGISAGIVGLAFGMEFAA